VTAPDGAQIPVPVGGIGIPGRAVNIREDAAVQISVRTNEDGQTIGYYVVVNNAEESNDEAGRLFGELGQEAAITTLERLATTALGLGASLGIRILGGVAGVIASVFSPSNLTKEIFIRAEIDNGTGTDSPPVTYCLLV